MKTRQPKVLFLIEDGSYLYDNRVRREATCLCHAGAQVSVICPNAGGEPFHSVVDEVRIYRYPKPNLGAGLIAHLGEYVVSLVSQTALALFVALKDGFSVIHAANPPDFLWLVAAPYRLFGKRFVFDHHDLVPELFEERFGKDRAFLLWAARLMERMSFWLASHVISTNESYRNVAMERGGKTPDCVTVVRNGPDPADFEEFLPDQKVRAMAPTMVGYLGNMNPQDGVDLLIRAAAIVKDQYDRTDIGFVLVGGGSAFDSLVALRADLGLEESVSMTGTVPWSDVLNSLSATDICVQPDPPGGLNGHSTMNKLMEYMILGRAVIAFDLPETRVSGGDAVVYVPGDSAEALAAAIVELASDEQRMQSLGERGRKRVVDELAWHHQSPNLISVYKRLFPQADLRPGKKSEKERKSIEKSTS